MNRRNFFNSAIAFIAALFTRKTTTLSAAPVGSSTTVTIEPILDDGRYHYYEWDSAGNHRIDGIAIHPMPNASIFIDREGGMWEFNGNEIRCLTAPITLRRNPLAFTIPPEPDQPLQQMVDRWHADGRIA